MSYSPKLENAILRRLLSQTTEAYEEQLSELHAEKEFHQITLESIVDGVITTNDHGLIRSLNPFAEELTGWSGASAMGKPLGTVFNVVDDRGDPIEIRLEDERKGEQKVEAILMRQDDRRFSVEFSSSPLRDRRGTLIGCVVVFQDVTERRLMQLQLSHEATHDTLTGVLNRRAFDQRLRAAVRAANRDDANYGLCYLDLDRFKLVNDTCGHFAGDELLRQVTSLIQEEVGTAGTLGRLGGDEFAVLVPDADPVTLREIASNVFHAIAEYRFSWGDKTFDITASMGVVLITSHFDTVDQVLAAADHCCYLSKEKGRNRIQLYDPSDAELQRKHGQLDWTARIEKILDQQRFTLHGQRIHALAADDSTNFFEVLIRIEDGEGTFLPGEVINAAESYGLMARVDRWVLEKTFETLAEGLGNDSIFSVNISALSLTDSSLPDLIERLLDEHSIRGEALCLEVSETAALTHLPETRTLVRRLHDRGCRFALDDFGAGMTSLTHLREVSFDYVKIHQTFVTDIINDPQDRAMVEAIHQLAHILGMKTIAESVSSRHVVDALRRIGVDYGQGFGLSDPAPLSWFLAQPR